MSTHERPNIIFILPDHQVYYGHDRPGEFAYQPPRFRQFAEEGVRFDRAYSVCPLCSPARSSMMTGLYPSAHGIRWNTEAVNFPTRTDFAPGQQLYSHYLSQAGYRNAYVGKWHCGHERLPVDFGIEGWSLPDYGKVYMSDAYRAYAEERGLGDARARIQYNLNHSDWSGQTLVLHDPSPWTFMNSSGVLEGPPEAHEEQFTTHLAIEKLRELAQHDQPFSLIASYWGPHQPYFPTEPYASAFDPKSIPEYPSFRDDLKGRPFRYYFHREIAHRSAYTWQDWSIWQQILARCYGQGFQTDAAIGELLDEVDRLGLRDNTIVIWCADHGDAVATHGGLWDKSSTFIEEVARVPFAIRWPAGIRAGKISNQLITNMDVTATILDVAGVPVPAAMHSRSLLPLCREESTAWSDYLVCEHSGHGHMFPQRMVVTERYKYVKSLHDMDELYDLETDPFEMHNRIDEPDSRPLLVEMHDRLRQHFDTSAAHDPMKNLFLLALKYDEESSLKR